jgi:hypothetical protein
LQLPVTKLYERDCYSMTSFLFLNLSQRIIHIALFLFLCQFANAQTAPVNSQAIHCAKVYPDILFRGVEIAPGQDSTQCVTVKNCGDTLEVFKATLGSGNYFSTPQQSPPIPPDSSFTFCITFRPKIIGASNAFLFIDFGKYSVPYTPLLGTTPCAHLRVQPDSFGLVKVGQKSIKTVFIVNDGDYYWKPGEGFFQHDKGVFRLLNANVIDTASVAAHDSIAVVIEYTPQSYGDDSDLFIFPNASPCGTLKIPVSGVGGCSILTNSSVNIPITPVGHKTSFTVTINNIGNSTGFFGSLVILGSGASAFGLVRIMPDTIPAGGSAVITITFDPPDNDTFDAVLTFSNDCNPLHILLHGVAGCAAITHGVANVPNVGIGDSSLFTITIHNSGNIAWNPGVPILLGQDANAFKVINIFPQVIGAGGDAVITMQFTRLHSIKKYIAQLTFPNSGPCQESQLSIDLESGALDKGVKDNTAKKGFSLDQNYPNPFSQETSFNFRIPKESEIQISLYDLSGKLVKTLIGGRISEGEHTIHSNAQDLVSGTYILRLESGDIKLARELKIVK